MKKILLILPLLLLIGACRTQKDVLYFKNIEEAINNTPIEYQSPTIQKGDKLAISVSAMNPELVKPYNLSIVTTGGVSEKPTFIVREDGDINYPGIGKIRVLGKTREQIVDELTLEISKYVQDPIVNIQITNFRVIVLGEVNNPGVVTAENERFNIVDAIAKSGDMSLYAVKDSVMLIRSVDGVRNQYTVNLGDAKVINSPLFYLKQNDILYVPPTKSKAMELNTKPITAVATVLGFVVAIIALFK